MAMQIDPIDVQRHLEGVDYPASKQDLVAAAESDGAPQEVIEALQSVDKERFDGPTAVQEALS